LRALDRRDAPRRRDLRPRHGGHVLEPRPDEDRHDEQRHPRQLLQGDDDLRRRRQTDAGRGESALRLKRVVALLLLLAPALARAVEYEIEIDITDEDDLYELWQSEQISEDTFNALLDLLRRGVDLNEADQEELYALPGLTLADVEAIVAYRTASGKIEDPAALVAAGVISDDKLERIAPFLLLRRPGIGLAASGRITGRTLWTSEDSDFPATALEAKVLTLGNLTLGAGALITRHRLGDVRWDPSRGA